VPPIPIIDLFAGPGGLGEGFSSVLDSSGRRAFKIKLSIEKDEFAHRTLELRAFFREFGPTCIPSDYYSYLRGEISRRELYLRHPSEAAEAKKEAWWAELGGKVATDEAVDDRINQALGAHRSKWLLIGGPPCQAYSLVGRSRIIGGEGLKHYEEDPRHELYRHYLRILAVHQPPAFIMENVKGLLSARVNKESMFDRILSDLKNPSDALPVAMQSKGADVRYRLYSLVQKTSDLLGGLAPRDFVVHAERYGIPQSRHRIIILGVRSDFAAVPGVLSEEEAPTVEQIIDELPKLRSGLSKEEDSHECWMDAIRSLGDQTWLGRASFDEPMREALFVTLSRIGKKMGRGSKFTSHSAQPSRLAEWFHDRQLGGVCNHETRSHIRADLHRYLFASVFARKYARSPLLEDLPKALLPKHENVQEALRKTKFNDRFRVQLGGRPSTTVTSHIAKDGHYFIHYDPVQCRSLTVREAARLQTFPDNYFFEGPRTEQYKQVGNAVPPLLANKIARVVAKFLN
jgi:DNA (cytosine-5)-methyltransferase 1